MMLTRAALAVAVMVWSVSACQTTAPAPESLGDPAAQEGSEGEEIGDSPLAASTEGVCWRRTQTRGVGVIPTECPNGERDAGLCYPRCPAGYNGVGPVCWQRCAEGYKDDGALCRRDAHIMSSDNSQCPWYDKCGIALAKGCSKCPSGYANDGCTCRRDVHIVAKATTTRGVGTIPICGAGMVNDAGLCYRACASGEDGVGPVCWAGCPAEMPVMCGAGCAKTQEACAKSIGDQVLGTTQTVVKIALQDYPGAVAAGIEAANKFNLPLCKAR